MISTSHSHWRYKAYRAHNMLSEVSRTWVQHPTNSSQRHYEYSHAPTSTRLPTRTHRQDRQTSARGIRYLRIASVEKCWMPSNIKGASEENMTVWKFENVIIWNKISRIKNIAHHRPQTNISPSERAHGYAKKEKFVASAKAARLRLRLKIEKAHETEYTVHPKRCLVPKTHMSRKEGDFKRSNFTISQTRPT